MIDLALATSLSQAMADAGLVWTPRPGDHFVVPDRELDDQVFVISEMVIEQVDTSVGPILAFNGTTEWALDSIPPGEVVWVPREDQLRELLGDAFASLERTGTEEVGGYAVTVAAGGSRQRHVDVSPEAAYARALLAVLR